jgi:hypothetical protein
MPMPPRAISCSSSQSPKYRTVARAAGPFPLTSLVTSNPAAFLSGEAMRSVRSKSVKNAWSLSAMAGCWSSNSWRLGTSPASTDCMKAAITASSELWDIVGSCGAVTGLLRLKGVSGPPRQAPTFRTEPNWPRVRSSRASTSGKGQPARLDALADFRDRYRVFVRSRSD